MSKSVIILLAYTALVPAIIGLINYKKLDSTMSVLVWLFVVAVVTEMFATALIHLFNNNMVVIYLYTIIESWLVMVFITKTLRVREGRFLFPTLLTVITLIEFALYPKAFPSVSRGCETVVIIYGLGNIINRVLNGSDIGKINYIFAGVLMFYFTTSLIYFSVSRFFTGDALYFIFYINIIINAIFNLSAGYVLWKLSNSKSSLFA